MQLNPGQLSALAEMGIPVWELRNQVRPEITAEAEPQQFSTEALDLSADFWLLLPSVTLAADEQRLLHAMLKAIKLDISATELLQAEHVPQLQAASSDGKTLLVFGDELAAKMTEKFSAEAIVTLLPGGVRMIKLPALDALLQTPVLKAQAWQALQRVRATA